MCNEERLDVKMMVLFLLWSVQLSGTVSKYVKKRNSCREANACWS